MQALCRYKQDAGGIINACAVHARVLLAMGMHADISIRWILGLYRLHTPYAQLALL
jgi:hypothetical protein